MHVTQNGPAMSSAKVRLLAHLRRNLQLSGRKASRQRWFSLAQTSMIHFDMPIYANKIHIHEHAHVYKLLMCVHLFNRMGAESNPSKCSLTK